MTIDAGHSWPHAHQKPTYAQHADESWVTCGLARIQCIEMYTEHKNSNLVKLKTRGMYLGETTQS